MNRTLLSLIKPEPWKQPEPAVTNGDPSGNRRKRRAEEAEARKAKRKAKR